MGALLRSRARWLPLAASLWLTACSSPQRPPIMAQVVQVRTSPAAVEAETWAPQAHAHAVRLEERAEQALRDGDPEAAQLLAEHAIAAHEHSRVLTRLARAERRRLSAEAELSEQRRVSGELQAQHQRLAAEAAGLELRAQVAKGALPLPPHEAAPPERERARRQAAGALATQGRLLCVAARLLGQVEGVSGALARLDQVERQLGEGTAGNVLETATEIRSECLRLISQVRSRASEGESKAAPPPADMLLAELSAAGAAPARDDRGVSVVLRDLFTPEGQLTEAGRGELRRFAQVAQGHPEFPVLVVGHTGAPAAEVELKQRLGTITSELSAAGASRVEAQGVGQHQPLLPSGSPTARERNQRIELIFVAPGL
jgi:outer membrane protein OmpA-like peptidoglycan-associated protein